VHRCVCPGSFDPVTLGHLDVIARAAELFDEVIVTILVNPAKSGLFPPAERAALLHRALAEAAGSALPAAPAPETVGSALEATPARETAADPGWTARVRVEVVTGGLLVDHCRRVGARAVVKGLRGGVDLGYEQPMAVMNRHLAGVETVFLLADPRWAHLSSSLVKEVAGHGADVRGLVPEAVAQALAGALGGAAPPPGRFG